MKTPPTDNKRQEMAEFLLNEVPMCELPLEIMAAVLAWRRTRDSTETTETQGREHYGQAMCWLMNTNAYLLDNLIKNNEEINKEIENIEI